MSTEAESPLAAWIEAWFVEHDDGEFTCADRPAPQLVEAEASAGHRILYTTKPRLLLYAPSGPPPGRAFDVFGRYGLPPREDALSLQRFAGARQVEFLGDLDPVDLCIFAWLRARLAPTPLVHLGLGDRFLTPCGAPPDHLQIACSSAERECLAELLPRMPDLSEIVGPRSLERLKQGRKLELEAIFCAGWVEPQKLLSPTD